jgi:hypothetical protein
MEMEGPPEHGHAAHRSGFRWLDISLALSAFFIGLISLSVAIHHGKTMDKLVASNSYPNIDIEQGNEEDLHDGLGQRRVVYIGLVNTGIGPARIRAVEVTVGGKPIADFHALLDACCTEASDGAPPKTHLFYSGDLRGSMLPAGKFVRLFSWPEAAADPRWARLEALRSRVDIRVCYCSVFEECYVHDSRNTEPARISACPVAAVPYNDEVSTR